MATASALTAVERGDTAALNSVSFPVAGMTCASCVAHVEKAIGQVPGVLKVSVNLATERADVTFSGAPDVSAVARAVKSAGYEVPNEELELAVGGMTCASCVGRLRIAAAPAMKRWPQHQER